MAELGLFCPTWHRPYRLKKVADNVKTATRNSFKLYFGCEPDDRESIMAGADAGAEVIINKGEQGYSDTMQSIYEKSDEPILFFCNDDFVFSDGWDVVPMQIMRKRPELMVLGVEDGLDNNFNTVHFVRRKYIKEQSGVVDMSDRVLYPYNHNFSDTEFTQTAKKRGVWDKVEGPCIIHLRLEKDETYSKNDSMFHQDHATYLSRLHLFS